MGCSESTSAKTSNVIVAPQVKPKEEFVVSPKHRGLKGIAN